MAGKSKPKTSKKSSRVMDVSEPGKTAPSASGRPIILGHKPAVQDPMVNEDNKMPDKDESEEHKIEVKRTGPKVIAPLPSAKIAAEEEPEPSNPEAEDTTDTDTDADTTTPDVEGIVPETEPEEEPIVDDESVEEDSVDEEPIESSKPEKDKGSSIVDAVADKAVKNKDKNADKKVQELQKRLAEVEKLVDDKKYFVKTSSATKKERKTRWAVLLLAIFLLAAGYLAIDAQLVKNDYWLPYHFFKEEKKQNDTTPQANTASQEQSDQSDTPEEAYTGKVIESPKAGYSLKIPDGWTIQGVEQFDRMVSSKSGDNLESYIEYRSGTAPVVLPKTSALEDGDGPARFGVGLFDKDYIDIEFDKDVNYDETEFTTDAGVKGHRYFRQFDYDPNRKSGNDIKAAHKQYYYLFEVDGKYYMAQYTIIEKTTGQDDGVTKSDQNRLELIEQVVKTLIVK